MQESDLETELGRVTFEQDEMAIPLGRWVCGVLQGRPTPGVQVVRVLLHVPVLLGVLGYWW